MANLLSHSALARLIADQTGDNFQTTRQQMANSLANNVLTQLRAQVALEAEIPAMSALSRRVLAALAGRFTKSEVVAMCDAFNGTLVTEHLLARPQVVVAQLEDHHELNDGIATHGADPTELLTKLRGLNEAEAYYLLREIVLWWNSADSPVLETLLKTLKVNG